MNRLALAQRIALECAVSGTLTTTLNTTGEQLRVVTWCDQAWNDVQTKHDDWNWMRSSNLLGAGMSFVTVAGQASYPLGSTPGTCGVPLANFGKWARDTFRCYTTTVGTNDENMLDPIDFDAWRNVYMYGANRSVQTRPVAVAIGPDESVCVGPPSNGLYTVTGDFFTAPTIMAADTDIPIGLPVAQHMLIVYSAMMSYAGYEAASEVYQRGKAGWDTMLAQLEAIKLPEVTWAGALV